MKAILISIKPKWCALMMNGKKTIEVRKENVGKAVQKLIDEQGFADIYVYCSKDEELYKFSWNNKTWYENFKHFTDMGCDQAHALDSDNLNGKVLFKFRCYKIEAIGMWNYSEYGTLTLFEEHLCIKSCLDHWELKNYIKDKPTYVIYISDLEIFDEPKELSEFKKNNATGNCWKCKLFGNGCSTCQLIKAPQSMCYVEVE